MVKAQHTENDRCILVVGPKERMLFETEVIVCQYSGMYLASGLGCDFNRSMQHLNSITREGGVADELPDEEIHYRA